MSMFSSAITIFVWFNVPDATILKVILDSSDYLLFKTGWVVSYSVLFKSRFTTLFLPLDLLF